ncbi:hypothetical protein B0T26DRAFT_706738 [Lasiosphaeria miniovina]|uniref:GYF domain-containing protein n=1 Tax=Lasiosphaeria miniovina TaxID=1954250 RepID=A0AA40AWZ6_9PEZI|nr:uncharacterized protein B0T26DRAFT_706738 [Lasiosphaeria miniovina]KAK0723538.1 hypothetical protein B0T26DRAFT_706738 [Lasiosphaeria miniovina]
MPSQLPSSFASAAAGQMRDSRGNPRGDAVRGSGSGEWPRANGTRTFRRPSTTPFTTSAAANPADNSQQSAGDVAPLSANSQPATSDPNALRYSKEELLDIYQKYKNSEPSSQINPSSLFMPNWNPTQVNGSSSRGWGKPSGDSSHVPQDPTVCWDQDGNVRPVGLEEMTAEEREMFATDVNSPLKPLQPQAKEGSHQGVGGGPNGRKTSISVGTTANHPTSSPSTASRPGTRRRETGDTNPFSTAALASPTGTGRLPRDDAWLPRRSTELKESITDEPEEDVNTREPLVRGQSFGLPRINTAATAGFGAPSLWGTPSGSVSAGIGAFGSFALNSSAIADNKRFGASGSRLAHLIPKESAENVAGKAGEAANVEGNRGWRPRQRTDTDPFAGTGEPSVSGSAILGGAQDNSPPLSSQHQRVGLFDTSVKGNAGDFGMSGLNLGGHGANGPASPSETNPYRSPLADRGDDGHDDDTEKHGHSGLSTDPPHNFGTLPRTFGANAFDGSDRSQTSSVGAKGFASVNPLTGWPAVPSAGTPDRERQFHNAFGGSLFSPLEGLPSPGLGGLGSMFSASSAGLGRGSKLNSLFTPAMQAQMQGQDQENLSDSVPDLRQSNPLGAIGRGPIGSQHRDTGSPVRSGRVAFDELYDPNRSPFATSEQPQPGLTTTSQGQSFLPTSSAGLPFPSTQSAGDPSAPRMMVMPDRMRWVYLDPQGTMQGPFNGLEMNDWYKANFFTADLRVKRVEDQDFEPLGQLIRRIGNSREPFLVPQMGVAHGPNPPGGSFPIGGPEAIPPLQNAFPSFGRTLTAQQQNDLERRKQEEQLYHARAREMAHHHHQTTFGRLPMQPGVPGSLQHHSSAHSLQSQPSFGSMASPIGMPPQPQLGNIAPNASFFDAPAGMGQVQSQPGIGPAPDQFSQDLNFGERQVLANMQSGGSVGFTLQPTGGDGTGLRSQLPGIDQLQRDPQGFSTRIQEFHDLRAQHDAEEAAAKERLADVREDKTDVTSAGAGATAAKQVIETTSEVAITKKGDVQSRTELSLTERVRRTQADAAAADSKPVQQLSTSGLPMPFPPPLRSGSPIPAPLAKRPQSSLPIQYDDRSASGTPDSSSDAPALAPPPTAPWAPQPGTEAHRGPSLKEIQEAEAKKAAKREEAAAALRRAAMEQEAAALREREKAAAVGTGLPPTSTWGTGSPVGAPATGSPWKQPAVAKGIAAGTASASAAAKKTLADIQREEEARKQRAREAAAVQSSAALASSMGKRYADLASKSSTPPGLAAAVPAASGGWSTVGAGGKVKIPTGPAAQSRTVSASSVKVSVTPTVLKSASKQASIGSSDAKSVALEEFKRWLNRELVRGLNGVANIDVFASNLLELPLDALLLAEQVYQYSTTMDGRHFGEEFVRRKKQADRGIIEKDPVAALAVESKNSNNGGWSEVAKKGSSSNTPKEDANVPGFKVVTTKKGKGKK